MVDIAYQVDRDLISGNFENVWRYVHPFDAEKDQITKEVFIRLCNEYYLPSLEKVELGPPLGKHEKDSGAFVVTRTVKLPDGSETSTFVKAMPTDQEPVVTGLPRLLLFTAMRLRHMNASTKTNAQWQIKGLEADIPVLKEIGVKGVISGKDEFVTFEERLEKLRSMQARQ